MSAAYSHTFHYNDRADFIRQLDAMLTKLCAGADMMEPYAQVRARYPHLKPTAFCNRLKRFSGEFPCRRGPGGRKILILFVTRELDAYLRSGKSLNSQPSTTN